MARPFHDIAPSFQGEHDILTVFRCSVAAPIAGSSRGSQADPSASIFAWRGNVTLSRGWLGLHLNDDNEPIIMVSIVEGSSSTHPSFSKHKVGTLVTPSPNITAWTFFRLSTSRG
jgi:hypothetical protein